MTKKRNKMTFTEGMKAQFSDWRNFMFRFKAPIIFGYDRYNCDCLSVRSMGVGALWFVDKCIFSSGCKSSLSAIFHCQCFMWSYNGVYGEGRTI